MDFDLEILRTGREATGGSAILDALIRACRATNTPHTITQDYQGKSPWLVLYGVGAADRAQARDRQLAQGGHAVLWDLGYYGRAKHGGYMRVSIDHQHPQAWLDRTKPRRDRWAAHQIELREDANPEGHILLIGVGAKSHRFLGTQGWEANKLRELRQRFPDRLIVYRPKRLKDDARLNCKMSVAGNIEDAMRGASLVVSRHSNCCVDAIIGGIPFEAEDGAATWLAGKEYTVQARMDFLRRLSYWQWRQSEMPEFLRFLREVTAK